MTLSQWATTHGVITEGAEPGRFHPYPYQIGILDAMSDPDIQRVTLQKSKRIGYTQIITFATGYFIQQDPSPIVLVQPTIDDSKEFSKDTIQPMLDQTACMRGIVAEVKSRDSQNTIGHKQYPGGSLHLRGANSMRGFRRLTKRIGIGDEIDAWPLMNDGDQIKALEGRTDTYGHRRKIILGSTPLHEESSRIARHYRASDMRVFMVPCTRCQTLQPITWGRIKWPEHNPERAYFECSTCKHAMDHREKLALLEAGLQHGDQGWHAEKPEVTDHAGFWIWAGYSMSPSAAWGVLAKEFLEVKDRAEELQTFTNEVLAQTWQVVGDGVDPGDIYRKRREHWDVLPQRAVVLTAGVDVQKDRLEVEVVAWSRDEESWSVAYQPIYGDPSELKIWTDLDQFLDTTTYEHESGNELKVSAVAIDSGSNLHTDAVYRYTAANAGKRRYAVKGKGGAGVLFVSKPTREAKYRGLLFSLGVDQAKGTLFTRLAKDEVGPGYCHFPADRKLDYFLGLSAERAVRKYSRGQVTVAFVHDRRIPNEPLDCRIYATAALRILNPAWKALEDVVNAADGPSSETVGESGSPRPLSRPRRQNRGRASNWVNSW